MIICMNCGERKEFEQLRHARQYVTEHWVINGENEEDQECNDSDCYDSETDECEPIECSSCYKQDVKEGLTKAQVDAIRYRHTKPDGTWSIEELPEEECNQEILLEMI